MPELVETTEIENIQFRKETTVNKNRNYIDDAHLTQILSEWKVIFDEHKAAGLERPRLPESVGEAIFDMAEALGKRFNFSGYSYLDEMRSDAILHCVKYIHNFNPLKKSEKKGKVSAFGYINMIIWRSFTHRIEEEKKEQYLKYKSFELMGGMDAFQDEDMNGISGGDEGGSDENLTIGVLGSDFIQKAREYEEKNLAIKALKKDKSVQFDSFLFDLTPDEEVEDDEELEIEFE